MGTSQVRAGWALAVLIFVFSVQCQANLITEWNDAALQACADSKMGPPMVARAMAVFHTCIYDAWAAYDDRAAEVYSPGGLRQSADRRTQKNLEKSISYSAYRCAIDLFPRSADTMFNALMARLGYDPSLTTADPTTPEGVGILAADSCLKARHSDGANQLGDLAPGQPPYSDYTGYRPLNPASTVPVNPTSLLDVNHWQPLTYVDLSGATVTPSCVGAQWGRVTPFAMSSGQEYRAFLAERGPALYPGEEFRRQAQDLITLTANLSDQDKMIAEYWADGPRSVLPPGHWNLFAQQISARDHHTVVDDVKLFFALNNAMLDVSIAVWDAKIFWDSVRPASAIPWLFDGVQILGWLGPGLGFGLMNGREWKPYQPSTFPTPPFPEFPSGHSAFSAAGAEVLRSFTGSDAFGGSITFEPGSSKTEPGTTPRQRVRLDWATFSEAADQAGFSRRLGGIHFERGDLASRELGRLIAREVLRKSGTYWQGQR